MYDIDEYIDFYDYPGELAAQFRDDAEDYFNSSSTGIFGSPLAPPENPLDIADEVRERLDGTCRIRGSRDSGVFADAMAPDAPRFLHETAADGVGAAPLALTQAHLRIAEYCTPEDPGEDIIALADRLKLLFGINRSQARAYICIGIMLRRLPRIAEVLRVRAHLPLDYLKAIARCVETLGGEFLSDCEFGLMKLITAEEDGQVLPGYQTFYAKVQHLVGILDPPVRPRELEPENLGNLPREGLSFDSDLYTTYLTGVLDKARAMEFQAALEAIAREKKCSLAEAITFLIHGNTDVKVCLNLYLPAFGSGEGYMSETGPLSDVVTEAFMKKATSVRMIGDSLVESYAPSDAQRAYVIARDGVCRYPGCDVPAHRCEIDHIREYDHDAPEAGGPTDTENMHCLCTTHHRLKTAGLIGVARRADSTEVYRSVKGGPEAISRPVGPAARIGRVSVAQHLQRAVATLRAHNESRKVFMAECAEVVAADSVREAMAEAVETVIAEAKRSGRKAGRLEAVDELMGEPQAAVPPWEEPVVADSADAADEIDEADRRRYARVIDEADKEGLRLCDPVFAGQEAAERAAQVVVDRYADMLFTDQVAEFEALRRVEAEFYAGAVERGEFDAECDPHEAAVGAEGWEGAIPF